MKDVTIDRKGPREILKKSLGRDVRASPSTRRCNRDAVESKLFGIGSESYVVGSHEFYLGYAVANRKLLTLDAGHCHQACQYRQGAAAHRVLRSERI